MGEGVMTYRKASLSRGFKSRMFPDLRLCWAEERAGTWTLK